MKPVTEKQRNVIGYIEDNLGIRFSGETCKEATEFITANIENSRNGARQFKERPTDHDLGDGYDYDELDFDAMSFDMFDHY